MTGRRLISGVFAACLMLCAQAPRSVAAEPEFVGVLALAVDAEVAAKLVLTDQQREDLEELIDQRESQALELALQLKDAPPAEREAKLSPFRQESEKRGLAFLSDEQRAKLEQIRIERLGLVSLGEPKIADRLKLTDEQKATVAKLMAERATELGRVTEKQRGLAITVFERKLQGVLNPEQRAAWDEMAGGAAATAVVNTKPAEQPAADPVGKPMINTETKPATAPAVVDTAPKIPGKLRFNFRFQPWSDVLDWFAQQADLSLVMDAAPAGTFNYTDSRYYSPAEAIDLLNSVLLTKGYTLVRRERMLMVVNLEDGIPPNLVPYVPLAELDKKGEFELVSVLFKIERLAPEEVEAEIRKLIGPQGAVVVLTKSGQVQVTETAGRLRLIRDVIQAIEKPEGPSIGSMRSFELKSVLPEDVLSILRPLLDIPAESLAAADGSIRIAIDPIGGKLFATGKPEKLTRIEEILTAIDTPPATGAEGPAVVETPQLEVYAITSADPNSVLLVLQTVLANNSEVRLAVDPKTGHLVALARPSQHATIRATIDQLQRDARQIEVIRLRTLDPQTAVLAINKLFTAGEGGPAPKVDADLNTRQLIVRGTAADIAQIRSLLEKMGEAPQTASADGRPGSPNGGGNVRMLPLTGRTARQALEEIEQIWPTMRRNQIRVVTPSANIPSLRPSEKQGLPQLPKPSTSAPETPKPTIQPAVPATPAKPAEKPAEKPKAEPEVRSAETGRRMVRVAYLQPQPQSQVAEQATKQGELPPIVVTIGPGGVIIASEDTAALDEFEALLTTLSSSAFAGTQDFTIFYLQNANAQTVAETLSQVFGGGSISSSSGGGSLLGDIAGAALGGGGGIMGALLGGGSSGGGTTVLGTGSVHIIPETRLNAIIVQAGAKDLDTIEQLLKVLDQSEVPETQVTPRPRMIAVMNTNASQIAEVVREVYQERLAGANRSRQPSPEEFIQMLRGGGRGGSSGGQRSQAAEAQKMTIGVDTRTNSLIVSAPQPLFEEVKQLVETLDQATTESNQAVRVVTLKKSNAKTVQQALTAIAGGKVRSDRSADSSSGSQSSSSSSRSSSSGNPSPEQQFQDQMRQRIEFFNSLRGMQGGQPGGFPQPGGSFGQPGGGFPQPGGGFPQPGGDRRDGDRRDGDRSRGR